MKFDPDGNLIARPFHKFFNLGEKRAAGEEPWQSEHFVLDKLDGSMIHPAYVRGELVFMTRMGVSAPSVRAFKVATQSVCDLCADMIAAGFTPIFEYTSPDNRIVLAYEKSELTLLAVRHIRTGAYMPHRELVRVADKYGLPVAKAFSSVRDYKAFWSDARAQEGVEGYVIAFDDGHRLKIKTDAYALRHKALAGLAHEKNLLAWVANGATDDVIPLLSPEAGLFVQEYQDSVLAGVRKWEVEIGRFVKENCHLPRKEFAQLAKSDLDPKLQSIAFRALDGVPVRAGLIEMLRRASTSATTVESVRGLFGMEWQPKILAEH